MNLAMYVYLSIDNFKEEPENITRLIGREPTKTAHKGEPIDRTKLTYKANYWQYRIDGKKKFDLEMLLSKLLSKFPNKRLLKKAVLKGKGQIVCVVHSSDQSPNLMISNKTLRSIADLGCSFWLDYYS